MNLLVESGKLFGLISGGLEVEVGEETALGLESEVCFFKVAEALGDESRDDQEHNGECSPHDDQYLLR